MSAFTVSRLAHDAVVSVNVVRDYLVRGLLRTVATGGYGLLYDSALRRLALADLDAQTRHRLPMGRISRAGRHDRQCPTWRALGHCHAAARLSGPVRSAVAADTPASRLSERTSRSPMSLPFHNDQVSPEKREHKAPA